jgi:hypothetical protein
MPLSGRVFASDAESELLEKPLERAHVGRNVVVTFVGSSTVIEISP